MTRPDSQESARFPNRQADAQGPIGHCQSGSPTAREAAGPLRRLMRRARLLAGIADPGARRGARRSSALPAWWLELLVLGCLYGGYSLIRNAVAGGAAHALRNGQALIALEVTLRLDPELTLNRFLQYVPVLAVGFCYYYATLHFLVTPAVLVWLRRGRPTRYRAARSTLALTTLLGLVGFVLLPTAPPRLLPGAGFHDILAVFHAWGWWSGDASAAPGGMDSATNQFAAMPSLHAAWSLWSGWHLARHAQRAWVRVLGGLYPGLTAVVVMATANHYLVDIAAGWMLLGLAALAVRSRATTTRTARTSPSTTISGRSSCPGAGRAHETAARRP